MQVQAYLALWVWNLQARPALKDLVTHMQQGPGGGALLSPRVSPVPHTQPGGPACLDSKPPYQLGTSWDLTFLIYKT